MYRIFSPVLLVVAAGLAACGGANFDSDQILRDVEYLASDTLEGRKTGTEGSEMAQNYIEERFRNLNLESFGGSYRLEFSFLNERDSIYYENAVNLTGYIPGQVNDSLYIVVTAHYDHLGVIDGEIYNGADDNASGTAGLMAAAAHFSANPPEHSVIFAALDAEEMGLQGARAFVTDPPVDADRIVLNINLDMVSRNNNDELYAAGTYHYPFLRQYVEAGSREADISVLFGHDSPDLPAGDDWTMASDHGAFHQAGIPFIYFGVEDHEDYHQPTDVFENIQPDFFIEAVRTIIRVLGEFDANLQEVHMQSAAESLN